jgi:plastocyanin
MRAAVALAAAAFAVTGVAPLASRLDTQGALGAIEGTVTLTVARGTPLSTSVYGRRGVAPKPAAAGPETRNVVVYLTGLQPLRRLSPIRATIAQHEERFVPAVTAIPAGSTVNFPNDDPFYHNVFSLSRAAAFDLGRYPPGDSRTFPFPKPGIVKVFCHLHSQMTALIMVFDHPWFTMPAESGAFTIGSIPPGDHTIVAWHDRIGERRERVRVRAGSSTHVSFTLPVLEVEP